MNNPRAAAFSALYKIQKEKAYSNITLNNVIKTNNFLKKDSTLLFAIVYGVLEKKLFLEYVISKFSKIKLNKIDDKALILLQMGIYQILFMDRIPNSAAVNEAVKTAKKQKLFSCVGFINAVLRSVVKNENELILLFNGNSLPKHIKYSCPNEVINIWEKSYGTDITQKLLDSLSGKAPIYVRVNTLKIRVEDAIKELQKAGITAEKVEYLSGGIRLESISSIDDLLLFKNGSIYIQDASSQLSIDIFSPQENDEILDVCAAPGGKSISTAILAKNNAKITACDLYEHKVKLINQNTERMGITCIKAQNTDALADRNEDEKYDKIICDVPCSGLGLIKRKPEMVYKENEFLDNNTLPKIQYKILCNAAKRLKKGGVLQYSTCSLNAEENSEITKKFLEENKNFEKEEIILPKGLNREIKEECNELTIFPFSNNTDGFYIAKFRKIL